MAATNKSLKKGEGMSGQLILVTGGSRSGKSLFAERLVRSLGVSCAYIATAEVLDEEMRERVARHRERRQGSFWQNYEAPYDAHELFSALTTESVLFDCVTIYLSNLLYGRSAAEDKERQLWSKLRLLVEVARKSGKNVVLVSNEVGDGIVPDNAMAREFRDLAGQANQFLAAQADAVYLVVAGLPVDIKKLAEETEKKWRE
jgi:adenosylcobinamide kinase/adenosylcobinamide-phosphate guanylyltransferase